VRPAHIPQHGITDRGRWGPRQPIVIVAQWRPWSWVAYVQLVGPPLVVAVAYAARDDAHRRVRRQGDLSGWSVEGMIVRVTVAHEHLTRIGSVLDDWDREDAASPSESDRGLPACAREALRLSEALQPVIAITIKLGAGPAPGADAKEDASWAASVALARRSVLAQKAAGIDRGLAADNLRLLDRINALIGTWPEEDWDDVARRRVQELVDARQRGRQRGQELRLSRGHAEPEESFSVGWLLRHPRDHWLRLAAPRVSDPECRALIEAQIAKLAPSHQQLWGLDWTAEEAVAEVICEMRVLGTSPARWKEPVSAVVTAPIKGDTSLGERIAIRLVEDPDGPFNGTLVSFLDGERWLICARELEDGTLLPLDGTRRRAMPSL
jgi:hypothetical protein